MKDCRKPHGGDLKEAGTPGMKPAAENGSDAAGTAPKGKKIVVAKKCRSP
jgi:hypothetical protein